MKNVCAAILVSMAVCIGHHTLAQTAGDGAPVPRATFETIKVDYDITEGGVKGMRIHLKFKTYSLKGVEAYAAIYFMDNTGAWLKDKNNKFKSSAGEVAVYKLLNPAYDPAVYDDLQIFMPYEELELAPGKYNLKMDVKLIYKEGGTISSLTKYDFVFTMPSGSTVASSPDAIFEDLWIDYDVTEGDKKGMNIRIKFKTVNMKDTVGYIAIYISKKNGNLVNGISSKYRSTSGQLAAFKSIAPAYKESVFNETLFLPYAEFDLGKGKFDLKMSADVIYKKGGIIKHLRDKDFWIEL